LTDTRHEIALTRQDVDKILSLCEPPTLLVGGQALAFWAAFFNVQPTALLSKNITSDADFVGTIAAAKKIAKALGWKV
jgi:hypothetical protein